MYSIGFHGRAPSDILNHKSLNESGYKSERMSENRRDMVPIRQS
jgi:hypothetical protein